jgi:FkbM family methyltransferase
MDANDTKSIFRLSNIITNNDILVDVGANKGDYTNFFKEKLNGTGKIYSIELHPETYSILKSTYKEDHNIVVLNFAVTNVNSSVTYYKGIDSFTHNIIGHDMNFTPNQPLGEIQGIRLDNLLKDENKIKLIKIDVEGAELNVLRGLSEIIDRIENIFVECHLDEDWMVIRDLLLNEYKMSCENLITGETIQNDSNRAYHCYCKKKYNYGKNFF